MPRAKGKVGVTGGKTPAAELEKIIKKFGLSQTQVAKETGMSAMTLKSVLNGQTKVNIERALIFAKYFGTTSDFWIDLQKKTGLAEAKKDSKLQKQLSGIKKAKPSSTEKGGGKAAGAKRGPKPSVKKAGTKKAAAKKPAVKKPRAVKPPSTTTTTPTSGFTF